MELREYFSSNPSVAVGFSGGTDSALLLWAATEYAEFVTPYFARTPFGYPDDLDTAMDICRILSLDLRIIDVDLREDPQIMSNSPERCYFCKKRIFGAIVEAAFSDGHPVVLDGTNASDNISDRPGYRALQELGVQSPLRLCGVTKDDVRRMSHEAGLPTWDRPSNSCLATRMVPGTPIDLDVLWKAHEAEEALRRIGYSDHRVRTNGRNATIVLKRDQMPEEESEKKRITDMVSGFMGETTIDDNTRRANGPE